MPGKHRSDNRRLSRPQEPAPGADDVPQLEIRDLRLLVAVAEEGTLTYASERLNVTQPALSRHLKTLETRLGTQLFSRTHSRLKLTPTGELLLRHAREVLEHLAKVEDEMRGAGKSARHTLRVGTQCYTAYHWLPAILSRFAAQHPRVAVEIEFEIDRRPLKPLLDGKLDVALMSDGWRGRGLVATRLFADEFVAIVPPGHPWALRSYVEAEDFKHVRLLLLVPPKDSTVMRRFIEPAGVKPMQVVDVQLVGALPALVTGQFGVGVTPSWTIAPELRSGRLVAVRIGRNGLKREWVAAVTKERHREPWIRDFVHLIASSGPSSGLMALDRAAEL